MSPVVGCKHGREQAHQSLTTADHYRLTLGVKSIVPFAAIKSVLLERRNSPFLSSASVEDEFKQHVYFQTI